MRARGGERSGAWRGAGFGFFFGSYGLRALLRPGQAFEEELVGFRPSAGRRFRLQSHRERGPPVEPACDPQLVKHLKTADGRSGLLVHAAGDLSVINLLLLEPRLRGGDAVGSRRCAQIDGCRQPERRDDPTNKAHAATKSRRQGRARLYALIGKGRFCRFSQSPTRHPFANHDSIFKSELIARNAESEISLGSSGGFLSMSVQGCPGRRRRASRLPSTASPRRHLHDSNCTF